MRCQWARLGPSPELLMPEPLSTRWVWLDLDCAPALPFVPRCKSKFLGSSWPDQSHCELEIFGASVQTEPEASPTLVGGDPQGCTKSGKVPRLEAHCMCWWLPSRLDMSRAHGHKGPHIGHPRQEEVGTEVA